MSQEWVTSKPPTRQLMTWGLRVGMVVFSGTNYLWSFLKHFAGKCTSTGAAIWKPVSIIGALCRKGVYTCMHLHISLSQSLCELAYETLPPLGVSPALYSAHLFGLSSQISGIIFGSSISSPLPPRAPQVLSVSPYLRLCHHLSLWTESPSSLISATTGVAELFLSLIHSTPNACQRIYQGKWSWSPA
jgi:hypothetical protein